MKLILALLLLCNVAFATTSTKTINLSESNSIKFNQAFTSSFVAKKQVEAMSKCFSNVGSTIYIVAYSPGGSVSAGQRFFDTLNALPCKFDILTVFGASMSYQMTQQLGKRYILPSGILMSHRASVNGIGGEIGGELNSIIKLLEDNIESLERTAANRVGISLEQYRKEIRDELWLTGEQAVKRNHADEVVLASCDNSLMGTHVERVVLFFGAYDVEFSDCPVITGPISVRGVTNKDNEHTLIEYYSNMKKQVGMTL